MEKYRSQEVALNKIEKEPLRGYKTAFCSPLALKVLDKKIFLKISYVLGYGLILTFKCISKSNIKTDFRKIFMPFIRNLKRTL
jgi:hypothetical protein